MDIDEEPLDIPTSAAPIFPLSRVKKIMKTDKDVAMCSADAVAITAMAAELFLEYFSNEMCKTAMVDKRKTILYKDAANTVKHDIRLQFLEPLIPQMIPVAKALELKRNLNRNTGDDEPEEEVIDKENSEADATMVS